MMTKGRQTGLDRGFSNFAELEAQGRATQGRREEAEEPHLGTLLSLPEGLRITGARGGEEQDPL